MSYKTNLGGLDNAHFSHAALERVVFWMSICSANNLQPVNNQVQAIFERRHLPENRGFRLLLQHRPLQWTGQEESWGQVQIMSYVS